MSTVMGMDSARRDNWRGKREPFKLWRPSQTESPPEQMIALNTSPFNPTPHTFCPCQAESSNRNNPSVAEKSNFALHYVTFTGLGAL